MIELMKKKYDLKEHKEKRINVTIRDLIPYWLSIFS